MNTLRITGGIVTSLALTLALGCANRTPTAGERILDSAASDTAMAPTTAPATSPATSPAVVAAPATRPVDVAAAPVEVTTRPAATATNPVHVAPDADQAARLRNWPAVVSKYPNGDVIAGPVHRILAPPPLSDRPVDIMVIEAYQVAIIPVQMVLTPFWSYFTPPTLDVKYHGEQIGPTYTMDETLPYYRDEHVPGLKQLKR